MATRAVVFAKPRLCKIGNTITIDVCTDENHTLNNTVTDHPVEEGFNVTDHSRPEPDVVTLNCFVSNTPLSEEQQARAIQEGAVKFTSNTTQAVAIGQTDGRANKIFTELKKLRDEGALISVVTTLKTYGVSSTEGMMIQSLTVPRTSKNYDGLQFSITLKQIRIVRNRQTRDVRNKDKRVGKKKKEGAKVTKPAEEETSALLDISASASKSDNATLKGLGNFALRQ